MDKLKNLFIDTLMSINATEEPLSPSFFLQEFKKQVELLDSGKQLEEKIAFQKLMKSMCISISDQIDENNKSLGFN